MNKTIFFVGLFVLSSCSSDIEVSNDSQFALSQQIPSASSIQKAQEAANNLFIATSTRSLIEQSLYPYEEAAQLMEGNLNNAVINDIYNLLKEQGYREELADAMYDYYYGKPLEVLVSQYKYNRKRTSSSC